jgi:hypothetical protein
MNKLFSNNKKGTLQDIFIIVVIAVVTLIVVALMIQIYFDKLEPSAIFSGSLSNSQVTDDTSRLGNSWDSIMMLFLVGMFMLPIIAAFLVGAHPAFMWASVLLGLFVILFGAIMNQVWDTTIENSSMTTAKAKMIKVRFIFDHFGTFLTAFICLLLISLFIGNRLANR